MMQQQGKTVLVTGASSGIGRAVSTLLLEQGYRVTGLARDFSKFPCHDRHFSAIPMDLSDLDNLPAQLDRIIGKEPVIDGVVCCAGSGRFGSLEEFSCTQIRNLLDLNLTSQICLVRTLLPGMKQRGSGNIIFMGSEAALSGGKRGAIYSAAKFGLRGLAQALRQECAASGLRISIVNPGMVNTGFFDELDFQARRGCRQLHPAGRCCQGSTAHTGSQGRNRVRRNQPVSTEKSHPFPETGRERLTVRRRAITG